MTVKYFVRKEGDSVHQDVISLWKANIPNTVIGFGLSIEWPFSTKVTSFSFRLRTKEFSPHRLVLSKETWDTALYGN